MNLSFRHYYWRWLKNICWLFVFFVLLMTIARTFFAFFFGDAETLLGHGSDLARAYWLGFRFDLMPLAYINALPFILLNLGYFLPWQKALKIIRAFIIGLLFLGYTLIIWLYVFDYGFYSYFQDHMNVLIFGFVEDDTKALLISIYKNYNVFLWLTVVLFFHYGLYRFIKFLISPFDFDLKAKAFDWRVPATLCGGIVLLALIGRGNFTRLPLSIEDAHISDNKFINEIALNGALSLNRAMKIRKTHGKDQFNYLKKYGIKDWNEAYQSFTGLSTAEQIPGKALEAKTPFNPVLQSHPPHVVLVVMESFGSYWNDADTEDFQILGELKNHFNEGILFKNFLSAENGTIGSIVSVASSQVIRPGSRFLSESEYMRTPLNSSGNMPFEKSGYETHFLYGGKLGWRDLGKFLAVQGFDKLWGADEIREAMPELNNIADRELGNEWGIFDEYLYAFINEHLRMATKPQLFLVLTTSNHPPFEYPSSYKPLPVNFSPEFLKKLTVNEEMARLRFTGIQYANQKVGEFLTRIKNSSLKENTIVALTGDHSYWVAKNVGLDQEFKRYAVPFYLSIPEKYRPANVDTSRFGSHEDIFPTLYHLALSDQSYIKLGQDIFSEESDAMNSSGLVASKVGAYHHDKFWKWVDLEKQIMEPTEATPELIALKRKAQSLIGLTDIYLKEEKKSRPLASGSDRP